MLFSPFFHCHSYAYCKLNISNNDIDRSIVVHCIDLMVQNIIYLSSKSVALSEQNKLIVGKWESGYTMSHGNCAPDWVREFLCIHVCLFYLWDWNVKGHRTHIKIDLMTDTHVFLYVVVEVTRVHWLQTRFPFDQVNNSEEVFFRSLSFSANLLVLIIQVCKFRM